MPSRNIQAGNRLQRPDIRKGTDVVRACPTKVTTKEPAPATMPVDSADVMIGKCGDAVLMTGYHEMFHGTPPVARSIGRREHSFRMDVIRQTLVGPTEQLQ